MQISTTKIIAKVNDISLLINRLVNYLILVFVYILGVGPTALLAKVFKKKFLIESSAEPKWRKPSGVKGSLGKMF